MSDNALVVVFPSIFAQNKISQLAQNIKKILELQNQNFQKIRRDDSLIIVEANDPVFASSSINLLFGIEKIAIAKQVKNDYDSLVTSIVKIGMNLLLRGERFYVKVEGVSKGFIPKDVEMQVTSSLIEKSSKLGSKPGTEDKYDKLIYTFLTKSNGYVCIFTDKGNEGVPNFSQNKKTICCIYDELSAIACLEVLRQGFDVKLILCYQKDSDLVRLVKITNNIIHRMLKSKIDLEFYKIKKNISNVLDYLSFLQIAVDLQLHIAKLNKIDRISLPLSPLIFNQSYIDKVEKKIFQNNLIPHIPLSGIDENIFHYAKNIGLEKYFPQLKKLIKKNFKNQTNVDYSKKLVQQVITTKKDIKVTLGPNNIHEIIDSLKSDH